MQIFSSEDITAENMLRNDFRYDYQETFAVNFTHQNSAKSFTKISLITIMYQYVT